jgi:hypothetical protein
LNILKVGSTLNNPLGYSFHDKINDHAGRFQCILRVCQCRLHVIAWITENNRERGENIGDFPQFLKLIIELHALFDQHAEYMDSLNWDSVERKKSL